MQRWLDELGLRSVDIQALARDLPLATMRVIDLARALAADPQILILDEMTAALPADLTETVFRMLAQWRKAGRSLVFISHRLADVLGDLRSRDRAARRRHRGRRASRFEGSEEQIVDLMLGRRAPLLCSGDSFEARPSSTRRDSRVGGSSPAVWSHFARTFRCKCGAVRFWGSRRSKVRVSRNCSTALPAFDAPRAGDSGRRRPCRFGDPRDAIEQGVVLVPADRAQALLRLRSIRENVALPMVRRPAGWGLIDLAREGRRVEQASARLEIDTRAQSEVRRLSGGNQQKVMIARWLASGFKTLLCFDPDARHRHWHEAPDLRLASRACRRGRGRPDLHVRVVRDPARV